MTHSKSIGISCKYFDENVCRSCDLLDLTYDEQILKKESRLKELFKDSFNTTPNKPTIFYETTRSDLTGFRNKIKLSVSGTSGKPVIGLLGEEYLEESAFFKKSKIEKRAYYSKGRELLSCPIHHPKLNLLVLKVKELIIAHSIEPFRANENSGEIKGIIAFISPDDEIYLRFISRSKELFFKIKKVLPTFLESLERDSLKLKVASVNIQPILHAFLEGDEELYLTDETSLSLKFNSRIFSKALSLSPKAFVQTNLSVAKRLYETASEWVKECTLEIKNSSKKDDEKWREDEKENHKIKFLELYSGVGAFSFFCESSVDEVLGIEINKDAVSSANESVKIHDLKNINFQHGDSENLLLISKTFAPDIVLVNPPRRGLGETVAHLFSLMPEYILYSSCEVTTLKKDCDLLLKAYDLKKINMFDLFPHSDHFETLVLLKRR